MSDVETSKVLALANGDYWFEIKDGDDARRAGDITGTAIKIYWDHEADREGGEHPRRWFVMVGEDGGREIGKVCLCVLPPDVETADPGFIPTNCHTTGYQNRPPYPTFAAEISALSTAIGIDLPPNYMGNPIREPNAEMAP